ncbi:MAG: MerR family transcriptional regulator [Elusimicrobia bacterium]|nr:MerR family transcriptional regulator [Elusimicrobiota bacterium]
MAGFLTAGKVAGRAGVNIQTVRYYERRGLLLPDSRKDSGYRLYSEEAVQKLLFIRNAQGLGFSLAEIARLLRLRVGHKVQCGTVKKQAQARLGVVQEKIAGLRGMEKALRRLIRTCSAKATTNRCPILESLEDGRKSP